jgi:ribonuclease-3
VDDLLRLQKSLGVKFHDSSLLQQALVHRSYLNESANLPPSASNERLEFLGDAILGLVIAEELYRRFPEATEGRLTEMRASLVRGATLARIGEQLRLGDYLVLGRGEDRTGGRGRAINLGRALEALIGAYYLDAGLAATRRMLLRLIGPELEAAASGPEIDPKSFLQQLAQGNLRVTPEYVTVATEGPEHERAFVVEVRLGAEVAGTGRGRNKRLAQQEAARSALASLSQTALRPEGEGLLG